MGTGAPTDDGLALRDRQGERVYLGRRLAEVRAEESPWTRGVRGSGDGMAAELLVQWSEVSGGSMGDRRSAWGQGQTTVSRVRVSAFILHASLSPITHHPPPVTIHSSFSFFIPHPSSLKMGWLVANRREVGFILQPEDGLL